MAANGNNVVKGTKKTNSDNLKAPEVGKEGCIEVHRDTKNPHKVWEEELKEKTRKTVVKPTDPESELPENCLRFVCLSDTHSRVEHSDYSLRIPEGDVLLHAGDFTMTSSVDEFEDFNNFLGQLSHKIKLVIPGNHETLLDPREYGVNREMLRRRLNLPLNSKNNDATEHIEALKKIVSKAEILIDSLVEICGIKIYGVPWMPEYASWGFGLRRGHELLEKYDKIPAGIDILLSHGPPVGFGDYTVRSKHVGCVELLNSVRHRIKPKYLVNGHIHEGYGVRTDSRTIYINAAVCNRNYRPVHDPIVFDFPLPHPHTRQEFLNLTMDDIKNLQRCCCMQ